VSNWSPVRAACRRLLGELPEISAAVTELIRSEVPAYQVVPVAEHRLGVREQLSVRLRALAEDRPLLESDLKAASDLAALRASQGVPIDSLINAYQIGDQELWRLLAEDGGGRLVALMPQLGRRMFAATTQTTAVMARVHSRVARDIDGSRISMAHQFLALVDDPAGRAEAALVATRLGLDANGIFIAFAWLPERDEPAASYEAALNLRSDSLSVVVRAAGDGRFEVVAQGDDPLLVVDSVGSRLAAGRLGIGLARRGVAGVAMSLGDARIALGATSPERPRADFARQWAEALILASADRIRPLTARGVEVARSQPHLARTVLAFADCNMSIAATSHVVRLHANSVTYRLGRWTDLTGMDPRTFSGLVESVIACRRATSA
jgi:hypothetical protein